jgi:hypothetical protein
MSFRRTSPGLSNMHLFLNVEAIVFVEGGSNSYSLEEVERGLYNCESIDLLFWSKIFEIFLPTKKLLLEQ